MRPSPFPLHLMLERMRDERRAERENRGERAVRQRTCSSMHLVSPPVHRPRWDTSCSGDRAAAPTCQRGRARRAWTQSAGQRRRRSICIAVASPAGSRRGGGQRTRRRRFRRVSCSLARKNQRRWRADDGGGGCVLRSDQGGALRRGHAAAAPATSASRVREREGGCAGIRRPSAAPARGSR